MTQMHSVRIEILYEPPGAASPLRVAETSDKSAVHAAVEAVVMEVDRRAARARRKATIEDATNRAQFLRRTFAALGLRT